jgi:prolyl oligopeptidase
MKEAQLVYPESHRTDEVEILHGVEVRDPYRWLEELDSEQVRAWITAQNGVTHDRALGL